MTRSCRICGLAVAALFLNAPLAKAALSALETRAIPSANGKYLLVLLTPKEGRASRWEESIPEQNRIEALFPQSGLYHNDGTTELLWPIKYLSTWKKIFVSNDGIHLVVAFLDWDKGASDGGNALDFYANGHRLVSHNESELLVGYWPRIVATNLADADRPKGTAANLDEDSKRFGFETNWGDAFTFDIRSGDLIDSRLPWSFRTSLLSAAALAGLLGCWVWIRSVRQRHQPE